MSILSVKNLIFSYEQNKRIIDDISFNVQKGEYISVIGHNGSGKSTLAKLLNGLLKADSGEIVIDGLSFSDKKNTFEIRKKVGVVFQNPDNQLIASIVEDDVAFGPENIGLKREEIGKRIDFALKSVGMENYRFSSPERLSGGQKQRIAIAGVLALKPEILILDESTSMLDPQGRKEILSVVKNLNNNFGTTVITITHYMEEVLQADKVMVLNNGKIALSGTPDEIFSDVSVIKNLGLELPLAAYIAEKMEKKGLNLNKKVMDKNDLAEALCKLL